MYVTVKGSLHKVPRGSTCSDCENLNVKIETKEEIGKVFQRKTTSCKVFQEAITDNKKCTECRNLTR